MIIPNFNVSSIEECIHKLEIVRYWDILFIPFDLLKYIFDNLELAKEAIKTHDEHFQPFNYIELDLLFGTKKEELWKKALDLYVSPEIYENIIKLVPPIIDNRHDNILDYAIEKYHSIEIIKIIIKSYPGFVRLPTRFNYMLPIHFLVTYNYYKYYANNIDVLKKSNPEIYKLFNQEPIKSLDIIDNRTIKLIDILNESFSSSLMEEMYYGLKPIHLAIDNSIPSISIIKHLIKLYPECVSDPRHLLLHKSLIRDVNFDEWSMVQKNKYIEITMYLLEIYPNGASIIDNDGKVALHYATLNFISIDVIKELLKIYLDGAKHLSNRRKISLHYAADKQSVELIKLLLNAYPEGKTIRDSLGNLPIDNVNREITTPENLEIIRLLS